MLFDSSELLTLGVAWGQEEHNVILNVKGLSYVLL